MAELLGQDFLLWYKIALQNESNPISQNSLNPNIAIYLKENPMFERTMSFWRRLLGSGTETLENTAEERRSSVRYSTNQEIWYRPSPDEPGKEGYCAQLINISAGGIKIKAEKKFQPGDLLSFQVPSESTDSFTWVLACVVHAHKQADHSWALGCNFSRELSPEDLQAFGVSPSKRQNPQEQRISPRLVCELEAQFQIVAEETHPLQKARVENISLIGLGLVVGEKLPLGALLNVELNSRTGETSKALLCCAVHVTRRSSGDWLVGCNFFAELEEGELNSLLSS